MEKSKSNSGNKKVAIFNQYAGEYWKNDAGTTMIFDSPTAALDYIAYFNEACFYVDGDEASIVAAPENHKKGSVNA